MNFLLDTNVVSEWAKPRPDPGVIAWLAEADEDRVFLSVVALAELRYGIERIAAGARRKRLETWLADEIPGRFENRLLDIDQATAHAWGRLMAYAESQGRPLNAMDGWIAATAERHNLALVTRNIEDFRVLRLSVVNPWGKH